MDDSQIVRVPTRWRYSVVRNMGKDVLGTAVLRLDPPHTAFTLWSVYVEPRHRRQGIARKIVEAIKVQARSVETPIFLQVEASNLPAIKLYIRCGFHIVDWLMNHDVMHFRMLYDTNAVK